MTHPTDLSIQLLQYAAANRPYFNGAAVFSDETAQFASPAASGSDWGFTLRTARGDADCVRLHVRTAAETLTVQATPPRTEGLFDYHTAYLPVPAPARYHFSIESGTQTYHYNHKGLTAGAADTACDFNCVPDFHTPDWAKGAVMYQIYVDRFCNGDKSNDVRDKEYLYLGNAARPRAWDAPVEAVDICTFYGGDLQGIIDKLGYLKDLGVEALYLNPIFVSPSSHKYDIQDYDYVDPHFGVIVDDGGKALSFEHFRNSHATMYMHRTAQTANLEASNALLARMIGLAHEAGIKVILDGVFNHCGAWNKWLDREGFYHRAGYPEGAYREADSPYRDYFRWYDEAWPRNDAYDSWWGHDNHPKLNYEASAQLRAYMLHIAAKWVSPPYNADGWRLDVAADLGYSRETNHAFWRDFRRTVKDANPEAVIIAEHYGDPGDWLDGTQWDTIMNYDAFMEPVTWFFTGMEKHSEAFRPDMLNNAMAFEEAMRAYTAKMPISAAMTAMNQLSNHDHSRFLTRTNRTAGRLHTAGAEAAGAHTNQAVFMAAIMLQMTWPGAPTLYYGDEAGLAGWTDPDNRRPYPWGKENEAVLGLYKDLIRLRRESKALRIGSHAYLYMNTGIISYARWLGDEVVAVAFNNNDTAAEIPLPVWKTGQILPERLEDVLAVCNGQQVAHGAVSIVNGIAPLHLPPQSGLILRTGQ